MIVKPAQKKNKLESLIYQWPSNNIAIKINDNPITFDT